MNIKENQYIHKMEYKTNKQSPCYILIWKNCEGIKLIGRKAKVQCAIFCVGGEYVYPHILIYA